MATEDPSPSNQSTIPAPSHAEDMRKELDRIAHAPQGRLKLSHQEMENGDGKPVIRFLAEPLPSDFGLAAFSGDLDPTDDTVLLALQGLEDACTPQRFREALGAFVTEIPED